MITLREIAQKILLQQGHKFDEKHIFDAVQKFRLASNNTQRIEAIVDIELEIEKIKDALDLQGFSRSGQQFEIRYFHLKKIAKELKII
jgi:hypothetical protein